MNSISKIQRRQEIDQIIDKWNSTFKDVRGISCIKSADSKFPIDNSFSDFLTVADACVEALVLYSVHNICTAIDNYYTVYINKNHYYKTKWNLGKFLYSGIHNKKGLYYFLPEHYHMMCLPKEDIFTDVRKNFEFVTLSYDIRHPLDLKQKTYMGISLEIIKERNVEDYLYDIESAIHRNNFRHTHLVWLEECIACLVYRKKDEGLLEKLLDIHKKEK